MDRPTVVPLRIGEWCVNPALGQISRDGEVVRVEERTLRLLLRLAQQPGEVVSIDDLIGHVWAGVIVTEDSVYQAVASLRRLLHDDPKQPSYIATVPRLGYRLVAPVRIWTDETFEPAESAPITGVAKPASRKIALLFGVGALLTSLAIAVAVFRTDLNSDRPPTASIPQGKSVAVLPFLDLTSQAMNEEYFADGMTEELIAELSKIRGFRVPAPTTTYSYKGTHATIAEIAKALNVAYVLDGSIRKSGKTLRVAARLVRALDGYVIWSENYDRPLNDELTVQTEIAEEIAKSIEGSIP